MFITARSICLQGLEESHKHAKARLCQKAGPWHAIKPCKLPGLFGSVSGYCVEASSTCPCIHWSACCSIFDTS
ncbi:hypothetical protein WJX79_010421 [Trebouxia sp. C0005]